MEAIVRSVARYFYYEKSLLNTSAPSTDPHVLAHIHAVKSLISSLKSSWGGLADKLTIWKAWYSFEGYAAGSSETLAPMLTNDKAKVWELAESLSKAYSKRSDIGPQGPFVSFIQMVDSNPNPELVSALSQIPQDDRTTFLALNKEVIKKTSKEDFDHPSKYIPHALCRVWNDDREAFIASAKELVGENFGNAAVGLSRIEKDDRKTFVALAKKLIKPLRVYGWTQRRLINILSEIEEDDREVFVTLVNKFTKPSMDINDQRKIINSILGIMGRYRYSPLVKKTKTTAFDPRYKEVFNRAQKNIDLPRTHPQFIERLIELIEAYPFEAIPPLDSHLKQDAVPPGAAYQD